MVMARTADEHHCPTCKGRFEVSFADGLDRTTTETLEVSCPRCATPLTVPVPKGARASLEVERGVGPDPDLGGGG